MKDALWGGGGGTHRSWPGQRGGRPRALIPGWLGGARARASVPGGVGGRGTGPRNGANFAMCVVQEKWRFLKDALWVGGGVPTGAGMVDGANFATCVVFLSFLF